MRGSVLAAGAGLWVTAHVPGVGCWGQCLSAPNWVCTGAAREQGTSGAGERGWDAGGGAGLAERLGWCLGHPGMCMRW